MGRALVRKVFQGKEIVGVEASDINSRNDGFWGGGMGSDQMI